ncbi:ABC transporter ATP-binding protein [Diplocloster agilis]|uniref:ABC transporter ATP-binding protein n=1 Tax=Diplocloster agilis TaxID=2850323 RepID=A0A949JYU0_9FIRM|nr:ABC transporter ATP-binding protein [Diplocloster agilis]MBU9737099.1 ABC transporter ATP-binding protein [Diplocloster agilis]MBU9746536.1 ABC transporter ATP-binding protein [Diplocloster agilis]
MADNQAIIQINGLTKKYGEKAAVNQLNLSVARGEVFGLLGPNGAGKTTTTLMLLGLTEPNGGTAFIDGKDCTRNPIEVKRIVGYLPDNVGFYPDMTGRENLRFTGRLNGVGEHELEERIDQLLERVGMTAAADQKTATYSKGMKQRLGIADVLMKDPQVIILDEPTNGIDPEGMHELLLLIRELADKDKRTIMISSHQLYQIQQVCDRVGIFVQGNLIACGRIEELGKQILKDGYYRLEMKAEPEDERLRELIRGVYGVEEIGDGPEGMIIRSNQDIREQISRIVVLNGYKLLHLRQCGQDLDEIYRRYFEKAGQNNGDNRNKKKIRKIMSLGRQDGE